MEEDKDIEALEALAAARKSPVQVISPWDKSRGCYIVTKLTQAGEKNAGT